MSSAARSSSRAALVGSDRDARPDEDRPGRAPGPLLTAGHEHDAQAVEHAVLHLLALQDGPVGSGTLLVRLQEVGYGGSEPTVGRILRSLDHRAVTTRVSNRGRTLTEAGRHRLALLDEAATQRFYQAELLRTIRPTTVGDLLDLLVARRALEREIARLAAEYATDEEIAGLAHAISDQRQSLAGTGIAIEADTRFHALLAQASRNRVLAAAAELVRRDQQATVQLNVILQHTDHHWVVGHTRILRAIERRSPAAAERAMLDHINDLISEIQRYRDHLNETPAERRE